MEDRKLIDLVDAYSVPGGNTLGLPASDSVLRLVGLAPRDSDHVAITSGVTLIGGMFTIRPPGCCDLTLHPPFHHRVRLAVLSGRAWVA